MATKNKKKKGTPMSLSDFHASVSETTSSAPTVQSSSNTQPGLNWAEEMERVDSGILFQHFHHPKLCKIKYKFKMRNILKS
jgi:hypothetical protein